MYLPLNQKLNFTGESTQEHLPHVEGQFSLTPTSLHRTDLSLAAQEHFLPMLLRRSLVLNVSGLSTHWFFARGGPSGLVVIMQFSVCDFPNTCV
mmetsp:Transcript_22151/g.26307  ORF Transcript_22151/g.26307 Transcript_22151/m.26307 type:complete len:94 (-) Transcript_22151:704-985(-)